MGLPLRQLITVPGAASQESSAEILARLLLSTRHVSAEVTTDGLLLHAVSELDLEQVVDKLREAGQRLSLGKPQIHYIQGDVWKEPYANLVVKFPAGCLADVRKDLQSRRAEVQEVESFAPEEAIIHAVAPMSELFGYTTSLRSLTRGRGTFQQEYLEYRPLPRI
jgi:predicted membrane GTPase involved in stress response